MIDTELLPEPPPRGAEGSFLRHVNIVVLTYLADGILAFATGILIARALGPDGRGAYGLFVLSAAFGQLLFGLGIGNAAIYYINKGEASVRDAVSAAHVVTFASGALTLGFIWLMDILDASAVLGIPDAWFNDPLDIGISQWLLIAAVPALLYWNLMRLILQAESRFVDLGISTIAQQALLITAIMAVSLTGDLTPTTAALCLIGATVAAGAFSLVRVGLEHFDVGQILWPRFGTIRKLAGFGLQGETGNILQLLNYRLDQYVVRYFVGLGGVGIYAVSVSMTEAMFVLANAVALVLLPRMTANEEEAQWIAPLATRNTVFIGAAGALCLAIAAPILIPLAFGDAYSDSVEPLWFLLPGTVALVGSKVLTSYIFSQGRPLVNTGITAASLVVTLAANLIFVPLFDVRGAAIASSIAYTTHFIFALFAFGRLSGRSPLTALVPGREDVRLYIDAWHTFLNRIGRRSPPAPEGPRAT
jgi:O-antigen/teichoic acid export membrane protein